ncbi:MAG TPA: ABC transporter permease, partial [Chloroflexota bacterium]|nr:ABC transporter permease [Chloroflexota bacterium]
MAFSISARTAADDPRAPEVPAARIPGQPGQLARYEGLLIGSATVVSFLIVWQIIAFRRIVPELFLPGPTDIATAFAAYVAKGQIWPDMWISGQELAFGFLLSIVFGLPLGILMGWYRRLNMALDPFVTFFYSIPRIALTPLLIIWFGIGINSKIAVVFLGAIFAILINTAAGVRNLDPALIKAARSFGASDAQLFRTIVLPGTVPFILTGLRLGLGHALTGVVVGELIAAQAGVGLMMATAGATFQTSKVF